MRTSNAMPRAAAYTALLNAAKMAARTEIAGPIPSRIVRLCPVCKAVEGQEEAARNGERHWPDCALQGAIAQAEAAYTGDGNARKLDAAEKMAEKLGRLLANVEEVARESFARSSETWQQDFKTEDGKGFTAWSEGRSALEAWQAAQKESR